VQDEVVDFEGRIDPSLRIGGVNIGKIRR